MSIHMSIQKQEKIRYKQRVFRASDEVWEKLKSRRRASGKTWNGFMKDLLGKEDK